MCFNAQNNNIYIYLTTFRGTCPWRHLLRSQWPFDPFVVNCSWSIDIIDALAAITFPLKDKLCLTVSVLKRFRDLYKLCSGHSLPLRRTPPCSQFSSTLVSKGGNVTHLPWNAQTPSHPLSGSTSCSSQFWSRLMLHLSGQLWLLCFGGTTRWRDKLLHCFLSLHKGWIPGEVFHVSIQPVKVANKCSLGSSVLFWQC